MYESHEYVTVLLAEREREARRAFLEHAAHAGCTCASRWQRYGGHIAAAMSAAAERAHSIAEATMGAPR
jgi:hypothetical protein